MQLIMLESVSTRCLKKKCAFFTSIGTTSNADKKNKTETHFSHYPRSQVDINSYTRLKIAMSLIAGKA
jgi:hypothetical protein